MSPPSAADGPPSSGQSPDDLPPLRDVIRSHGLAAKKSLGQNFIQDLNLTRRIARIGPDLAGASVVEIGPGPGGLTRGLLLEGAAEVIAIERDDRCLPALAEIAERYPGRLKVHAADALTADWPRLLADAVSRDVRIIANLPYGVATRLLIGWLETEPWPPWFTRMTLMFQKEVAERIVAAPGTSAYGRLSVISQWRTRARIALTLSPSAFTPPPKVESAVVDFEPRARLEPTCNVRTLGRVTAAAFGQRRKMLRSTLKPLFPGAGALGRTLSDIGIAGERRGETLTVEDFARLAAALDALEVAQTASH
jgi:16S rRNA (adenine1518-N6/adenine1519-N6)-dimethyltransferase